MERFKPGIFVMAYFAIFSLLNFILLSSSSSENQRDFSILEGRPPNTFVGNISQKISKSSSIPKQFRVDFATGVIRSNAILDREQKSSYSFDLTYRFQSGFKHLTVNIKVEDVNDEDPKFSLGNKTVLISEARDVGYEHSIGLVSDGDEGLNAVQKDTVKILSGNVDNVFKLKLKEYIDKKSYSIYLVIASKLRRNVKDRYVLNITASDKGTPVRTVFLLLTIIVEDFNDCPPTFTRPVYSAVVSEFARPATTVLNVTTTDCDFGKNAEVKYEMDYTLDKHRYFGIKQTGKVGYIQTNLHLDYETKKQFKLRVFAKDLGLRTKTSQVDVVVDVRDENDHRPEIGNLNFYSIKEDAPINATVASVKIYDKDSGENARLDVKLEPHHVFYIRKVSKEIYFVHLKMPLDREVRKSYKIVITAVDHGKPPKTSKNAGSLIVGDVNDNPPIFNQNIYTKDVMESEKVGSPVVLVHATDADSVSKHNITYHIISTQEPNCSKWFGINSTSGLIYVRSDIDREQYAKVMLVVEARDNGIPEQSANCTIVLNILNINDNSPQFSKQYYTAYVPENSDPKTFVLQISASDKDIDSASGNISYYFDPNSPLPLKSIFSVNKSTGVITTLQGLDREKVDSYEFGVVAKDEGELNGTAMVNVTVEDINDNNPFFKRNFYNISVLENITLGSPLVQILAYDKDLGWNAAISYEVISGNQENTFLLDKSNGLITLKNNLDREKLGEYLLKFRAIDNGGLTSLKSATVKILVKDVNDDPPVFMQKDYGFNVIENTMSSVFIGAVLAKSHDEGPGGVISYSIKTRDVQHVFHINDSGAIFTRDKLDHEIRPKYVFTVEARDHGDPRLFGYVNVTVSVEDVNDNPPVWSNPYIKIELLESRSVGDVFFTFHASDKDAGKNGEVTYGIAAGSHEIFDLDPLTGELSLSAPIDYEQIKLYQLTVNASDSGTPFLISSATVNIAILDYNDNVPVLNQSHKMHIHVNEDIPLHAILFTFHASDKDSGENGKVWFKLDTLSSFFDMSKNGVLTLKSSLDRERSDKHELYIVAGDLGQPFKTSHSVKFTVYVDDVNDETPTFSKKFSFVTTENEKPGTVIGRMTATDGDIGVNSELEYSLVNSTGEFEIKSKTGVIRNKVQLDRDEIPRYSIKVKVSDKGVPSKSSITIVDVDVQDVNDNAPKFTKLDYSVKVPENVKTKTEIVQVKAHDRDNGLNGTVVYYLNTGNTQGGVEMFQINKDTGVIFIVASLDREIKNFFVLSVVANDKGHPPRDAISKVLVTVLDVNDHKPAFELKNDSINVSEKFPVHKIIYMANATDPDQGPNGNITYSIIESSGEEMFKINSISGEVILTKLLDYEKTKQYTLRIQASDNPKQGQKTSILNLYINVIDSNDNSPFFIKNPIFTSVKEGKPRETKVHSPIIARDNDSGINSRIVYSIVSQSPKPAFKIDPFKAQLTTDVEIDREDVEEYTLVIKAIDQAAVASEQLSATVTVKIIVLDINDCAPVFTSRSEAFVMEDEPLNYTVITFTAEDKDLEKGGKVIFSIVSGNHDGMFELDPSWDSLILKKLVDREKVERYHLKIKATDQGVPQLSTNITFVIYIQDVNDNQPQFSKYKYEATICENEDSGTEVLSTLAKDADSGQRGELSYSIPTGIASDLFVINKTSGVISTVSPLDREKEQTYQLTVYVSDNYDPYYTNTTTVLIRVADKNDNVPYFSRNSFEIQIPENQPPGFAGSLVALDADDGVNAKLVYSIKVGNEEGHFEVNQSTGILSTLTYLDREKNLFYNLVVQVKDSGNPVQSTSANITVTVLDENDNAPRFSSKELNLSIPQNSLPGTSVVQLTAVDDDESSNAVVAYSFGLGVEAPFGLDATTGLIYTLTYLNARNVATYNLIVVASDQSGSGPLNQSIDVNIFIDNSTSVPLRFTEVFYKVNLTVPEEAGRDVLQLRLENQGFKPGDVEYHRESGQTVLSVGSTKGNVSFTTRPNSGGYMCSVRATLVHDPSNSALCFVVVAVGHTNYQRPSFASSIYYATLDENTPSGTSVAEIIPNTKGNVTFQLVNGNEFNAFRINSRGKIVVDNASSLDYERTRHFELDVKGDWGNIVTNIAFTKVYITIRNVDDKAPVFRQNVFVASIPESSQRGRIVSKLYAFDFGSSPLSFAIISGNNDKIFSINHETGELRLEKTVNRESRKRYNLTVSTSSGTLSSKCIVLVLISNINNHSPKLPSKYTFNVSEKSPRGSRVGQVTAVDEDDFSILTYSVTNGKQQHGPFIIDLYSGTISLIDTLDYETLVVPNLYSFDISVSDRHHEAKTRVVVTTLDHNDNKPRFLKPSYNTQLKEKVPVNQQLEQVNATDSDNGPNGMIIYSLTPVEEVDIDSKSGRVYCIIPLVHDPYKRFIDVVITATDQGSPKLYSKVPLRIRVLQTRNKPLTFEYTSYHKNITEDTQIGTLVVKVKATNSDWSSSNKRITYSILPGDDKPDKFYLEERTGILRVHKKLDREKKAEYSFLVSAKDDSSNPQNDGRTTVRISIDDVNDNAPTFQPNSYYIKKSNDSMYQTTAVENATLNTKVLTVFATDEDVGPNKNIEYSISSGNDGGWFSIDSYGQLWLVSSLDRDDIPIHRLSVRATDQGDPPKASEISVVIKVRDINDNSPVFVQPKDLGVLENADKGSSPGIVKATDLDFGLNKIIDYSIINGTGFDFFKININTGELTTTTVFDYEEKSSYSLTIKAEDQGFPRRSSILFTIVQIRSVDEYEPVFLNKTYSFVVPGNSKKGVRLGQVQAIDADGGPDGVVNYELVSPVEPFAVNISTGEIYLTEDFLDHLQDSRKRRDTAESIEKVSNSYELTIEASSGRPGSRKDSVKANMDIDYMCSGCKTTSSESNDDKAITETVLILIAVLGVVGFIVLCVTVICLCVVCKRRGCAKKEPVKSEVIGLKPINESPYGKNGLTNPYNHVVSTSVSSNSQTSAGSSGCGSADGHLNERDFVAAKNTDIESLENKPFTVKPDSGIQIDYECGPLSRESDVATSDARLSDVRSVKTNRFPSRLESRESLHQFDDEGGREASGGVDVGNLLYAKLTEVNAEEDDQNVDRPRVFKDEGRPDYTGSLSSILGSHEELRGHYNYFYTMNQGPQYHPLSDVFSEIGRLPTQDSSKQSDGALSNRTSMLSSVSSLHNQHLDAESTYSSLPMTPNFTPAITPLVTRSPSISPLTSEAVTPMVSPSQSRPSSMYLLRSRPSSSQIQLTQQRDGLADLDEDVNV